MIPLDTPETLWVVSHLWDANRLLWWKLKFSLLFFFFSVSCWWKSLRSPFDTITSNLFSYSCISSHRKETLLKKTNHISITSYERLLFFNINRWLYYVTITTVTIHIPLQQDITWNMKKVGNSTINSYIFGRVLKPKLFVDLILYWFGLQLHHQIKLNSLKLYCLLTKVQLYSVVLLVVM